MESQSFGTIRVNNIVFVDKNNKPIPANQVLTTRGDGGITFSSYGTQSPYGPFTTVQAGYDDDPNKIVLYGNAAQNRLLLLPGSGIEFGKVSDMASNIMIQSIAPEQIIVGTSTLSFLDLETPAQGGRALYFQGTGDVVIGVSSTTLIFDTKFNTNYSSIIVRLSTLEGVDVQQSTSIEYVTDMSEQLSTFVYSTFVKDVRGNRTILQINSVKTSSITLGYNSLTEGISKGNVTSVCTPYIENEASTINNFLYGF